MKNILLLIKNFLALIGISASATLAQTSAGLRDLKPYDIIIENNVFSGTSYINLELDKDTDSLRLELFNNKGEFAALLYEGIMAGGEHHFEFIPAVITRPYIAVLSIAEKVVSMRVVKFNSF